MQLSDILERIDHWGKGTLESGSGRVTHNPHPQQSAEQHPPVHTLHHCLQVSNGHLHLNTGLDGDRGDLLHHVGGGVQVDQALVDAAGRGGEGRGETKSGKTVTE